MQNLKNSKFTKFKTFTNLKFTKFPNFQIPDVNFIPIIGYVNPNLSIFVELIDMDSLDQLQPKFNS